MKALELDRQNIEQLLDIAVNEAKMWLSKLDGIPAAALPTASMDPLTQLPDNGCGLEKTLRLFIDMYQSQLSGSAGPRYWGYVTGGTTPAALIGDWLATAYDQCVTQHLDSVASHVEQETIAMLLDLFGLPSHLTGYFVSGATMSNFTGLAMARQWIGMQYGVNVAGDGMYALPQGIPVLAAKAHSSVKKALSMLGIGRDSLQSVNVLPEREAIDIDDLSLKLQNLNGQPAIVVASAGTVNTVDYDDISAIVALKERYPFWLHVDASFGGFAACSPSYASLLDGWKLADSITVDAHKWLNVPYDSAMIFTPHADLLYEVFQNNASYLGEVSENPDPVHMSPQNSRRFRALSAWFSLMAYGKDGYRDIVERQIQMAHALGDRIQSSSMFRLLASVRLNVGCFALNEASHKQRDTFLEKLHQDGTVFMTPTTFNGVPGIRAAFSNWRTTITDVDLAWNVMENLARKIE